MEHSFSWTLKECLANYTFIVIRLKYHKCGMYPLSEFGFHLLEIYIGGLVFSRGVLSQ